jgi:hypothetical protein
MQQVVAQQVDVESTYTRVRNLGGILRNYLVIARDSSGARVDGFAGNGAFQIRYGASNSSGELIQNYPTEDYIHSMIAEQFGYGAEGQPADSPGGRMTGVFPWSQVLSQGNGRVGDSTLVDWAQSYPVDASLRVGNGLDASIATLEFVVVKIATSYPAFFYGTTSVGA